MAGGWQGPSVTSGGVSNLWLSIPLTASLHRCRSRNERRKCSNGKKRGVGGGVRVQQRAALDRSESFRGGWRFRAAVSQLTQSC